MFRKLVLYIVRTDKNNNYKEEIKPKEIHLRLIIQIILLTKKQLQLKERWLELVVIPFNQYKNKNFPVYPAALTLINLLQIQIAWDNKKEKKCF